MIFGWKNKGKTASREKESAESSVEPIDYERLAKYIAKAIVEENDQRTKAYSVTREWIKYLTLLLLAALIILMVSLCVGCFIAAFKMFGIAISRATLDKANFVILAKGLGTLMLSVIFFGIALTSFFAGKEFDKETDKQFVMSVFSGTISLVALLVALAALYRG